MNSADAVIPKTLTVVIPTYQRPGWLKRAVGSLGRQTRLPDEVVVVMRDTDEPTHRSAAEIAAGNPPFVLRQAFVSEPGFMPPVKVGLSVASGDVIAVMDDDAEANESMVERFLFHYKDPSVGAVGGRCINMVGQEFGDSSTDVVVDVPPTDVMGKVTRFGLFVGNMTKRPTFTEPIDADFMIGGCMSFRRSIAKALEFDMQLNRNVADGYEIDLGLQVRARGVRIVLDPEISIRHYSAPRAIIGLRSYEDTEAIFWAAHNHIRVALRRLPLHKSVILVGYMLAIGTRRAPGLVPLGLSPIARRMGFWVDVGGAAVRGRLAAIRHTLQESFR